MDLGPLVAGLTPEARCVLLERFMEDAYHDEASIRARGRFRELLEEEHVATCLARDAFEEFAELVDDEQHAILRSRVRLFEQPGDEFAAGSRWLALAPRGRRLAAPCAFERVTDISDRIAALANDGDGSPARRARLKSRLDFLRGAAPDRLACGGAEGPLGAEQRGEGHGQAGFAAATGAGPGEGALPRGGHLAGHAEQGAGGRALADEALQGVDLAEITVDADVMQRECARHPKGTHTLQFGSGT